MSQLLESAETPLKVLTRTGQHHRSPLDFVQSSEPSEMSDSPPIKVNRTIFKHVKPKNDPDLQLKEIREAHRKKWEQERQAEGSGLQQESSSARDGPGGTARSSEGPQGESANGSRKRKAVDSESDEIEFVSQAKKPKTKVVEAPRSLFATVPVLPVSRYFFVIQQYPELRTNSCL